MQIDVDLPLPGRKSLFSIGPFKLDFVDTGWSASFGANVQGHGSGRADGRASLTTNIDAVVSGQSMVTLQKVEVRYERNSGLKVDFDLKNSS